MRALGFGPDISIGEATVSAVASDLPPALIGAGLLARPAVRFEPVEPEWDDEGMPINRHVPIGVVPSPCRRLLAVPYRADGGHECDQYCPGRQRDGGCLTVIVRNAQAAGVPCSFEIDSEGYWAYNGPLFAAGE